MNRPTASPAYFPYREHRNMAQVMADEAAAENIFRDYHSRVCPTCGAKSGLPCVTRSGEFLPMSYNGGVHNTRSVR